MPGWSVIMPTMKNIKPPPKRYRALVLA